MICCLSKVLMSWEIEAYDIVQLLLFIPECYFAYNVEIRVLKLQTCFSQKAPFISCKIHGYLFELSSFCRTMFCSRILTTFKWCPQTFKPPTLGLYLSLGPPPPTVAKFISHPQGAGLWLLNCQVANKYTNTTFSINIW